MSRRRRRRSPRPYGDVPHPRASAGVGAYRSSPGSDRGLGAHVPSANMASARPGPGARNKLANRIAQSAKADVYLKPRRRKPKTGHTPQLDPAAPTPGTGGPFA